MVSPTNQGEATALSSPPHLQVQGAMRNAGGIVEGGSSSVRGQSSKVGQDMKRPSSNSQASAFGPVDFDSLGKAENALPDQLPEAAARIVKNLPLDTTADDLVSLFRPFGPIHRATLTLAPAYPPGSGPSTFKGQASVIFYREEDAVAATNELHCYELGTSTLTVQKFEASRVGRRSNVSIYADTPSPEAVGLGRPSVQKALNPDTPSWTQTPPIRTFSNTSQKSIYASSSPPTTPIPLANKIVKLSPNPTTPSPPKTQDPCNLFVKNLDLVLTSQDLFFAFKSFGRIVSAKVMMDEVTGVSKGFGFVSFVNEEGANAALESMDGKPLAGVSGPGKNIVVRLHETKALREGKVPKESNGSSTNEVSTLSSSIAALELKERSTTGSPIGRVVSGSNSTTTSPGLSPTSGATERERLVAAVKKMVPGREEEIVDLMEGLPKKERALCLFNPDHLKLKVADALQVLDNLSDEEVEVDSTPSPSKRPIVLPPDLTVPTPTVVDSPAPLPVEVVARPDSTPSSVAELGRLSAKEIISLIEGGKLRSSLGIVKVSIEKEQETSEYMKALEGKPSHEIKQKLGERLFKAIKALGIKGAPKITINLLDSEDLLPLAHLIDYPLILKEKVLSHTSAPAF